MINYSFNYNKNKWMSIMFEGYKSYDIFGIKNMQNELSNIVTLVLLISSIYIHN